MALLLSKEGLGVVELTVRKVGSPYQPMEVLTAVVYDASLIHPTATTATATKPLRFRKL